MFTYENRPWVHTFYNLDALFHCRNQSGVEMSAVYSNVPRENDYELVEHYGPLVESGISKVAQYMHTMSDTTHVKPPLSLN